MPRAGPPRACKSCHPLAKPENWSRGPIGGPNCALHETMRARQSAARSMVAGRVAVSADLGNGANMCPTEYDVCRPDHERHAMYT